MIFKSDVKSCILCGRVRLAPTTDPMPGSAHVASGILSSPSERAEADNLAQIMPT